MNAFLRSLPILDRHPPRFEPNAERDAAFLAIGEFLETHARQHQPCDLKRRACPVWPAVRDRLMRATGEFDGRTLAHHQVSLWQMYNNGVVIKSDDVLIGMDIIPMPRGFDWEEPTEMTSTLAGLLDLLLVTHRHTDHYDSDLVSACLRMGKPVMMPASLAADRGWDSNLHAVEDGWELEIADIFIHARQGVHVWRETPGDVPLVYYEVTLQEGYSFIFGGDVDYTKSFQKSPDKKIDLLFLPWRNPNELYEDGHARQTAKTIDAVRIALDQISPAAILFEHCGELGHVYDGFPASFDMALGLKKEIPTPSELMFWGEHIDLAT